MRWRWWRNASACKAATLDAPAEGGPDTAPRPSEQELVEGLRGAATQLEVALRVARRSPLDAPSVAAMRTASATLQTAWQRLQAEPTDLPELAPNQRAWEDHWQATREAVRHVQPVRARLQPGDCASFQPVCWRTSSVSVRPRTCSGGTTLPVFMMAAAASEPVAQQSLRPFRCGACCRRWPPACWRCAVASPAPPHWTRCRRPCARRCRP